MDGFPDMPVVSVRIAQKTVTASSLFHCSVWVMRCLFCVAIEVLNDGRR